MTLTDSAVSPHSVPPPHSILLPQTHLAAQRPREERDVLGVFRHMIREACDQLWKVYYFKNYIKNDA